MHHPRSNTQGAQPIYTGGGRKAWGFSTQKGAATVVRVEREDTTLSVTEKRRTHTQGQEEEPERAMARGQ